jgi:GNAT superfamily N-acetyltransferase
MILFTLSNNDYNRKYMTIRPAQTADKNQWLELWKGYLDYYQVDLGATQGNTENTWQRLMNPPSDGPFCLVCEDDNDGVVGFTHYVFHAHTWQPEPRCYLIDLFTQINLRGKGVGRTLIEGVYSKASEHGCDQVYWLTQDSNQAGRRLYDQVADVTPFIKYQHIV